MSAQYKHVFREILEGAIEILPNYIAFDYDHGDILMGKLDSIIGESVYNDGFYIDKEKDPEKYSLVLRYYDDTFTGGQWYDKIVLPDINEIIISNVSGFNEDPRSHRDDYEFKRDVGKRIHECSPTDTPLIKYNNAHDECFSQEIYSIDKACFYPRILISKESGITWGDVMYGIMMIKGSKNDWHYELLVDTPVNIESNRLTIKCTFDWGS